MYNRGVLAALVPMVAAHGFISSPAARQPGSAYQAACGQQPFFQQSSDINGNVQGILQVVGSDLDEAACNVWLCKGFQFDDNTANVQSFSLGQTIDFEINIAAPHTGVANVSVVKTSSNTIIGSPLIEFENYASNAGVNPGDRAFSVTLPEDLEGECTTAGDCVLQWYWDAADINQTYESCVDFTVSGGAGNPPATPSNPPTTPSGTPSVPSSTPAPSDPAEEPVEEPEEDDECPADDDEEEEEEEEEDDECPADDEEDEEEEDDECPADEDEEEEEDDECPADDGEEEEDDDECPADDEDDQDEGEDDQDESPVEPSAQPSAPAPAPTTTTATAIRTSLGPQVPATRPTTFSTLIREVTTRVTVTMSATTVTVTAEPSGECGSA